MATDEAHQTMDKLIILVIKKWIEIYFSVLKYQEKNVFDYFS